ncbi:hypothetical protein [Alishewanella longhuensis]
MTPPEINDVIGFVLAILIGVAIGYVVVRLIQKPQWLQLTSDLSKAQQQLAAQQEALQQSKFFAGRLEERHHFNETTINRLQEETASYKSELKQVHAALAAESKKAQHYETTLNEQEKQYQLLVEQYQGEKAILTVLQQEHSVLRNQYRINFATCFVSTAFRNKPNSSPPKRAK